MSAQRAATSTHTPAAAPAARAAEVEEPASDRALGALPAPELHGGPPDHPTARPRQIAGVRQMQRTHGNRFVQRTLAARPLQRDGDSPAAQPEEQSDRPLDTSGLHMQEELDGAGLVLQRARAIQRDGDTRRPTATVSLTSNEPTVSVRPGAEIGAAHGRPGAVGWTTPSYDMQVDPSSTGLNIIVRVTLGFNVELPSDYDAPRQAVVRDHEIGHIRIGERKAKEHLVDGLKTALESHTGGATVANVRADLQAAVTAFVDSERTGSQGYDNADYARMVEAYRGTRASLRELSTASPAIGAMAGELRRANTRVYSAMRSFDEAGVEAVAESVRAARGALSAQELARLQYNQEFQGLVSNCGAQMNSYLSGSLLGMPFETLPDRMRNAIGQIVQALGGFTFSPTGASAGF